MISSGPPRGCLSSSARVSRSRFARRATAPTLRPALVEGDPVSNWPAGAERAWAGAPLSHLQGRAPHRAGALASRRPACWATADAARSRSVTTPGEERSSGGLLRLVKILMSILAGRAWQGWAVRPTCVPPQHSNSVLSRYRQNPVLVLTVRADTADGLSPVVPFFSRACLVESRRTGSIQFSHSIIFMPKALAARCVWQWA